jgi:hypothetical protein
MYKMQGKTHVKILSLLTILNVQNVFLLPTSHERIILTETLAKEKKKKKKSHMYSLSAVKQVTSDK